MAQDRGEHLNMLNFFFLKCPRLSNSEYLGTEAQWMLEGSSKGLLAVGNDTIRSRREAALLWRRVESVRPIADREGAEAMEDLLAATTGRDGLGCSLTAFSEAFRRHESAPKPSEPEWKPCGAACRQR